MCGITGIISRQALTPRDVQAIRRANAAMIHRGPDGAGEYLASANGRAIELRQHDDIDTVTDATPTARGSFAHANGNGLAGVDTLAEYLSHNPAHMFMAMRRLAIIDLQGGWQPLYNENRSIAVIANGEIYNFIELRAQLEAKGHTFRTHSDCETICHLYEDYGLDFVQHLRGMFAIALWDSRQNKLILARDRMGEKPLYIRWDEDRIFFASEMKAMLATGMVKFELDAASVNEYIHYCWVPEPNTVVKGVRKLRPGHMLTIDVSQWEVIDDTYWTLENAAPVMGDPTVKVRAELETILDQQLRSDVPIGIALSGGLDSSAIAALAAIRSKESIHAFSVGYPGRPKQDERMAAKELASELQMPFHEVELSTDEMVEAFPRLNYWRDEPIADIAGYGYYTLSRQAKEHGCRVLLQGQGGDELFWGYQWSIRALIASGMRLSGSGSLRCAITSIVGREMFSFDSTRLALRFLVGWIMGWRTVPNYRRLEKDEIIFYDVSDSVEKGHFAARRIFTNEFNRKINGSNAYRLMHTELAKDNLNVAAIGLLCRAYLALNGLAQGDRLSMANSVELRLPLVDYRLVELVVGLQKTLPEIPKRQKQLLARAVCDIVPNRISERPKKGFNPPVREWSNSIRNRFGQELTDGYLVSSRILDPVMARKLGQSHSQLTAWNEATFRALVLENWCNQVTPS